MHITRKGSDIQECRFRDGFLPWIRPQNRGEVVQSAFPGVKSNQMESQQFALVSIERLLTPRRQLHALTRLNRIEINSLPQSSALLHIAFSQSALASASFA
jgi:hypothetical protein